MYRPFLLVLSLFFIIFNSFYSVPLTRKMYFKNPQKILPLFSSKFFFLRISSFSHVISVHSQPYECVVSSVQKTEISHNFVLPEIKSSPIPYSITEILSLLTRISHAFLSNIYVNLPLNSPHYFLPYRASFWRNE